MTTCPKCSSADIGGPSFRPAEGYLGERLVYWCRRCGYQQSKPTHDAPQPPVKS